MTLEQCLDLQLILLAVFVIVLIVLMEQIAEYFYFKKKDNSGMKIKIVLEYLPGFFDGDRLPAFADKMKYFIMYKKHWWQRYIYLKDFFGRPMKFDSQESAEEYLEREGINYKKA